MSESTDPTTSPAIIVPPAALLALSQRRFGGRADPLPQLDQASAYLDR
jgi:hypothetical protein